MQNCRQKSVARGDSSAFLTMRLREMQNCRQNYDAHDDSSAFLMMRSHEMQNCQQKCGAHEDSFTLCEPHARQVAGAPTLVFARISYGILKKLWFLRNWQKTRKMPWGHKKSPEMHQKSGKVHQKPCEHSFSEARGKSRATAKKNERSEPCAASRAPSPNPPPLKKHSTHHLSTTTSHRMRNCSRERTWKTIGLRLRARRSHTCDNHGPRHGKHYKSISSTLLLLKLHGHRPRYTSGSHLAFA